MKDLDFIITRLVALWFMDGVTRILTRLASASVRVRDQIATLDFP